MDPLQGKRTCLYTPAQLTVVLDGMSKRIAGLLAGRSKVAIIGILRRGAPLADLITTVLVHDYAFPPPLRRDLHIKRYADDLTLIYPQTYLNDEVQLSKLDFRGYTVLVVDDVLYSGHSLLCATSYLAQLQPDEIRVAALVDRGTLRLPVYADVVGVRLDVAPPDIIECHIPPFEPSLKIELFQPYRH